MIWLTVAVTFLAFVLWVETTRYLHYRRAVGREVERILGTPLRVFRCVGKVRWWERPTEASIKKEHDQV